MKLYNFYTKLLLSISLTFILSYQALTQDKKNDEKTGSAYEFIIDYEVVRTPVKDQYRTGTCWCFATISFLESEILRNGGDMVDLSEMYVVRHTYPKKAMNYIRLHGDARFSQGGLSHDVINQIKDFGIVPEQIYNGKRIDEEKHNHDEMFAALEGFLNAIVERRGGKVTPRWIEAFQAILDVYLGLSPMEFNYQGKKYTPKSFFKSLNLKLNDYIELSSFSHHPFYKQFRLEIPDNWSYSTEFYNIPLDDMVEVIDNALISGFSVVWDGDVSDTYFSTRETGYAIVPLGDRDDITEPVPEREITQEYRQKSFDNFTTTDDHLMHIVGIAHNQNGTKFYLTKNSGGTDRKNEGYVFMSQSYVRLRTTCIMINKNCLPKRIKAKLDI
jgi:bleomycin hydrolase